ncbi:hypothetical protein NDU88_003286 [Pleurodeles waltl]|uniref:Uncharacterized protein n=1 Tax=Pleurodeles waltl TaxID=8319 RepID=A0AAV7V093_PLEWA|nr:hypothetical protein NDU88_003286 [Pleurodeles waltl]
MLWECPRLTEYWGGMTAVLKDATGLDQWDTPAKCMLGLHPGLRGGRVQWQFADLAFIWQEEVTHWGLAESAALRREEYHAIRKKPIALEWDALLEGLEVRNTTSK